MSVYRRRELLGAIGGAGVGALAGCASGGDRERLERLREDADVIAGPDGRWVFDPEEIAVTAGETVTWFFDSRGHNVCGRPGDSKRVDLPEGAEPFGSYAPDRSPGTTEGRGEVYEHTFEVTGTYVYVCFPHQSQGMVGRVRVEA